MRRNVLLIIVLLLAVLPACRKKHSDGAVFTIINPAGNPAMNIAIYASAYDYAHDSNSITHGVLGSNGTFTFPAALLTRGQWYYIDAYSSDYMYTNWMLGDKNYRLGPDSATARRFKYTNNNSYMVDQLPSATYARLCLLNGNRSSNRWRAYDELNIVDGHSEWSYISSDIKYFELEVSKNSTGVFSYVKAADTIVTPFSFASIDSFPLFRFVPDDTAVDFFMANTVLNVQHWPVFYDTATVVINGTVYLVHKY